MRVRREPTIIGLHPPIDSKDPRKPPTANENGSLPSSPAKLLRYQKDPSEYAEDPWLRWGASLTIVPYKRYRGSVA
ncbi:hypothetical protein CDAR_456321 [Caerostris darwini]|uniref:Uncharacterized protein n=1 Tax=Caerostris darwini TaxID=1538125 RepID=A0AAV4QAI1_9ARAC|nr:hypothetical protein CDAR_456321 [Caerostris darwini]